MIIDEPQSLDGARLSMQRQWGDAADSFDPLVDRNRDGARSSIGEVP